VPIGKQGVNPVRFDKPFDQGANSDHRPARSKLEKPQRAECSESRRPRRPRIRAGKLTIEAPDTIRFDVDPNALLRRGTKGWQKGKLRWHLRRRGSANGARR